MVGMGVGVWVCIGCAWVVGYGCVCRVSGSSILLIILCIFWKLSVQY